MQHRFHILFTQPRCVILHGEFVQRWRWLHLQNAVPAVYVGDTARILIRQWTDEIVFQLNFCHPRDPTPQDITAARDPASIGSDGTYPATLPRRAPGGRAAGCSAGS